MPKNTPLVSAAAAAMLTVMLMLGILPAAVMGGKTEEVKVTVTGDTVFSPEAAGRLVAAGLAALQERQYTTADERLSAGLRVLLAPAASQQIPLQQQQVPEHPQGETDDRLRADALLGRARARARLGRYDAALADLAVIEAAADRLASDDLRAQTMAKLLAERSTIEACAGRLQAAIEARQDTLLLLDGLLAAAAPDVTNQAFAVQAAELARLLLWARRPGEAAEVTDMAVKMGHWVDPRQLPGGGFAPGLATAPWWRWRQGGAVTPASEDVIDDDVIGGGGAVGAAMHAGGGHALVRAAAAIEAAAAVLTAECDLLVARGIIPRQSECLDTVPRAGTRHDDDGWRYISVYGQHGRLPDHTSGTAGLKCNPETPAACDLARHLLVLLQPEGPSSDGSDSHGNSASDGKTGAGALVRIGYSVIGPGTHIRPHWGPTNTLLKLHMGLTVPTASDGSPCCYMSVAEQRRPWRHGKAAFFDDSFLHEVWNNCSAGYRSVLQVVFQHPALSAHEPAPHIEL